jgi:hypothetical protein
LVQAGGRICAEAAPDAGFCDFRLAALKHPRFRPGLRVCENQAESAPDKGFQNRERSPGKILSPRWGLLFFR